MLRDRIPIGERISYWPASSDPLCSDIAVYEGADGLWIFDVGFGDLAAKRVNSLPGKKRVVLSHFHQDHMGNLPKISWGQLYLGQYTFRHAGAGHVVAAPIEPEPGVRLFPIPSSHAKGCIGMEVDEMYAFVGDATYCTAKHTQGRLAYNANLLADELNVLRALKAQYFLLSHDGAFVRKKADVLAELEEIYARRVQGEAYIFLDE